MIGAIALMIAFACTLLAARYRAATQQLAEQRSASEATVPILAPGTVPSLADSFAELASHLPSDVKLSGAERAEDGRLRITLDTADPDALHAQFAVKPWLRDFRFRAQEVLESGQFRVTFERSQD